MNRRTANNYTEEKVSDFLGTVRSAVRRGSNCKMTFNQICRLFKFGSIAIPALKNCGFVKISGRGFNNWKWMNDREITKWDVVEFIAEIERQKIEHSKKYRPAIPDPEPEQKNVVQFKKAEFKKAVQAELPIHPVRLAVLNGIRTELNEIRMQLEKIEDRIDQETTKKAAGN